MTRTPEERDLALECLKLAHSDMFDEQSIVRRAEAFYAFTTGQTPRETIDTALDRAGVK